MAPKAIAGPGSTLMETVLSAGTGGEPLSALLLPPMQPLSNPKQASATQASEAHFPIVASGRSVDIGEWHAGREQRGKTRAYAESVHVPAAFDNQRGRYDSHNPMQRTLRHIRKRRRERRKARRATRHSPTPRKKVHDG